MFHKFYIPIVLEITHFAESSNISASATVHPVPHLKNNVMPINEVANDLQDIYIPILISVFS